MAKVEIERARDFVEKILYDDNYSLDKSDYYVFILSYFMLYKESFIKKDSTSRNPSFQTLYFDCFRDADKIPLINKLGDYIINNGEILMNQIEVELLNDIYHVGNESIKRNVWIINKLRDAIGHGAYLIDFERGVLVIDNDHSADDFSSYCLKCEIPFELLESFCAIERASVFSFIKEERLKGYFDYISSNREIFNVSNSRKRNVLMNILSSYESYIERYKDGSLKDEPFFYEFARVRSILSYTYDNDKSISLKEKEKLKSLLDGEVNNTSDSSVSFQELYYKLLDVLNKMSDAMGASRVENGSLIIPALYNYCQVVLSNVDFDEYKKGENVDRRIKQFGYLKISSLLEFEDFNNSSDRKSEIQEKNESVERKCIDLILAMEKKLDDYKSGQEKYLSSSKEYSVDIETVLKDCFFSRYDGIMETIANRNMTIIGALRNSIDHGNVTVAIDSKGRDAVRLLNRRNQNDDSTATYELLITPENLYDLTSSFDYDNNLEIKYTIDDFLAEIKKIVSKDTYKKLVIYTNILRGMNLYSLDGYDIHIKRQKNR